MKTMAWRQPAVVNDDIAALLNDVDDGVAWRVNDGKREIINSGNR